MLVMSVLLIPENVLLQSLVKLRSQPRLSEQSLVIGGGKILSIVSIIVENEPYETPEYKKMNNAPDPARKSIHFRMA